METTKDNIRQLLEMLDNPDAYSEQQIRHIINQDEDTRETYRLLVEAKRSSRLRQAPTAVDTDAAWQRLLENVASPSGRRTSDSSPFTLHSSRFTLHSSLQKMAASFVGVLFMSGIAFAAIHIARQHQKQDTTQSTVGSDVSHDTIRNYRDVEHDTSNPEPVIYDNTPLEKMLPEIAAHYHAKVTFLNDEVRGLRFRFVWNPQQGIEQVISDLNQFERLTVTLKGNQITVDGLLTPSEK